MSLVMSLPVNSSIEITWDKHQVTGHRSLVGSVTSPTAPPHPEPRDIAAESVTSCSELQRLLTDVNNENVRRQSTYGSNSQSSAVRGQQPPVDNSDERVASGNGPESVDSWKHRMLLSEQPMFRLLKADSTASFDLSLSISQVGKEWKSYW
jgi:hypothetical protein